jgi:hypothetical protein
VKNLLKLKNGKNLLNLALVIITIMLLIPTKGMSLAFAPFATPGDLGNYADKNFSSFEGDDRPFEGYTGEGDEFVDFGGPNRSFATEINDPRIYVMTLINAAGAARNAYIIPGMLWVPGRITGMTSATTAAGAPLVYTTVNTLIYPSGFVRDGAFNDATGEAGLSATGNPKSIEQFFSFIKGNPMACNAIKFQSSESSQMDQQITQRSASPFRALEEKIWTPGAYQNQDTYRDKIIMFPTTGLILSDQTQLEYPIVANSTLTITFFCGAVLNAAKALETKRDAAVRTFSQVGLANVQQYHAIKGTNPNIKLTGRR